MIEEQENGRMKSANSKLVKHANMIGGRKELHMVHYLSTMQQR